MRTDLTEKKINNRDQSVSHEKPERLSFYSKASGSSTASGTVSFFLLSSEPLRPLMSELMPEVVVPFSLMTCRGLGQQSGMKASLVEGFQSPFLRTGTKQNIHFGGEFLDSSMTRHITGVRWWL